MTRRHRIRAVAAGLLLAMGLTLLPATSGASMIKWNDPTLPGDPDGPGTRALVYGLPSWMKIVGIAGGWFPVVVICPSNSTQVRHIVPIPTQEKAKKNVPGAR